MLLDQIDPGEKRVLEAGSWGENTWSIAVGRQQDLGQTYPLGTVGTVPRDPQKYLNFL